MRLGCLLFAGSLVLTAATTIASASTHVRRGPTAPRTHRSRSAAKAASSHAAAAKPGMTAERATEIQTALIKAGYLSGSPSGSWDASSQAAMEKLQADNGWQTKLVPDSRAIIKLGLGPKAAASTPQSTTSDTRGSAASSELNSVGPSNR